MAFVLNAAMAGQAWAALGFSTGAFTSPNSPNLDFKGVFPVAENEAGDKGGINNGGGTITIGNVTFGSGVNNSLYFNATDGAIVGSTFAAEPELNQLMKGLSYRTATSSGNTFNSGTGISMIPGFEYKLQLVLETGNHGNA